MVKKVYQNPEGGLNAKGRAYFKAKEGANLKPPVSAKEAAKSPKKAGRRKSFCARMSGVPGPMNSITIGSQTVSLWKPRQRVPPSFSNFVQWALTLKNNLLSYPHDTETCS